MIDGDKIIEEYEKLPHGKEKENAIKRAIKLADEAGDYKFAFHFRNNFIEENELYGDSFQSFILYPELMKIYDEHEDEFSQHDCDLLIWSFKWILGDCSEFYQIPKKKIYSLFDEFKSRCERYGYSLRTYYQYLYYFECSIDKKAEQEAFHMYITSPRDYFCDPYIYDIHNKTSYELNNGLIDKALEIAQPILSGELKATSLPESTYNKFMLYYLRHGDLDKAKYYCDKCYELISQNISYLWAIGDSLVLYSLIDLKYGVELFEKHLPWDLDTKNFFDKMSFYIGAAALFSHLSKKTTSVEINIPTEIEFYRNDNNYKTKTLADYYYKKAYDLCEKFDKRNENDRNVEELKKAIEM